VALRGLAAIALGIMSLFWPKATFLSIVLLFGIYALVDGVLALGLSVKGAVHPRGAMIFRGLVGVAAGLITLLYPGLSGLAMIYVIAAWAVISGGIEMVMAISMRRRIQHEWLLGTEGVLSIIFGILLAMSPLAGAIVLGLWIGAFALVLGGILLSTAFRLRSREHERAPTPIGEPLSVPG
jgi:uncharacterized membrane protein HdeD (DUF308 family)